MITTIEEGIKFWHDILGMNTIPADTRNKKPLEEWKRWQTEGTPDLLQLHWETNGKFANGINIVLGKIHHSVGLKDYYLACIDLDNEAAIREFCNFNGKQLTLQEISENGFLVEQHLDNTARAHIYVITKEPLKKKVSSIPIDGKWDENIPKIEVKIDSLVSVTPSVHEKGCNYQFVGNYKKFIDDPIFHDKNVIERHIDNICKKYKIEYLTDDANANQNYNHVLRNKQPIPKGQRHVKLLSFALSLILKNYKKAKRSTIYGYLVVYNNNPEEVAEPLPETELRQIFNDVWNKAEEIISNGSQEYKVEKGNGEAEKQTNQVLSVSNAKRLHSGIITVQGTITSVSEIYVLEIKNKDVIEYRNAKSIQLEDIETLDDNDRLNVVLYDENVNNVKAGETVKITGNISIEDKKPNNKSKKKFNVLHARSIEYLNRKEILVTEKDIESFDKFVSYPNVIERLVSMFAPNIIGHNNIKRGLLRSAVGGVDRGKNGGGRIDTLEVGDAGTAKSKLGAEITELKPNSRHVSAPHGTSKTITAVPEKVNDVVTVMLGAIPLSKYGICAIDEINSWSMSEQALLLDVMEEGSFDFNKMGVRRRIPAPTTIVATLNPIGGKWDNPDVATTEEFNLKRSLIDRFSQIYTTRDNMTEEQIDDFISEMDNINQRKPFNYNFIRKYLIYASSIKEVTFTKEARFMLNNYWKQGKLKNSLSIRNYKSLYKIAEAQAKLQLKDVVDEIIAQETINDFDDMMRQYDKAIGTILSPQQVAYKLFLDILQESDVGMTIEEICRIAIHRDNQVLNYINYIWEIEHNKKLRDIIDSLENHPNVKRVQNHPIILQWLTDPADPTDRNREIKNNNESEINNENQSARSARSDMEGN